MFLVNVWCLFTTLSLLRFAACAVLGAKFAYFRRLRDYYMYNGMIASVQSCFVDVVLAAIIQIKNVSLGG